ncbi:TPA: hypothetical protein QDA94_006525 [Burkholderia vietnamiensis]|uniref:hypothetical protein n=1 Tax=Burkholderia vietnamiensis TaxID=60552 RepID=UPI0029896F13|nr:hypothetical protein [Burkholderia vietnamiensis]HDR9236272.1 hypothetical protein [Burkholderia vietnamiensis]
MATKNTRSRMTAQSKANIGAAVSAKIVPMNDGYAVELTGKSGGTAYVENAAGPIAYSSMAAAKSAVKTHNSSLDPSLKPTI